MIVFALLLCVANYLVLTLYDVLAFRYIQKPIPYRRVGLSSFVSYTFSHNLGFALLSGGAVRYRFYSLWGFTPGEIALVITFSGLHFWLGLLVLGGVLCFVSPESIFETYGVGTLGAYGFGLLLTVPILWYLYAAHRRKDQMAIGRWVFSLPRPGLIIGALVVASIDWMLAAGVLYALLPAETEITYLHLLAAFFMGQISGVVSHVPGGLGVFETVMVVALKGLSSPASLLGSLVLFRAIYYLLPFLVGVILFLTYELKHRNLWQGLINKKVSSIETTVIPTIPSVIAGGTYISGCLLLLSAFIPTPSAKLRQIEELFPLWVLESSHLFSVVAGVCLLLCASGLRRRIRLDHRAVVTLLLVGAVTALLRGVYYEEAALLIVNLVALLVSRRAFRRRVQLFSGFSANSMVGIVLVALSIMWVGFFSYKKIDYTPDLWTNFSYEEDVSRALRGGGVMAAMICGLALFTAFRSGRRKGAGVPSSQEIKEASSLLHQSQESRAQLAVLGSRSLLFDQHRKAFLMYRTTTSSFVGIGDPIGDADALSDLLWEFRDLCDENDSNCVFFQVSSKNLPLYVDLGLRLTKLGEEGKVYLRYFSLSGRTMKSLREVQVRFEKEQITFEVIGRENVAGLLPELTRISHEWKTTLQNPTDALIVDRTDPRFLGVFPLAILRKGGEIVAYAHVLESGTKEECSIDIVVHRAEAPDGLMGYLILKIITWGKQQGYKAFNLGMAPLRGLENRPISPLWNSLSEHKVRFGEKSYTLEQLREFKEMFNPVWEPRYLISPDGRAFRRVLNELSQPTWVQRFAV